MRLETLAQQIGHVKCFADIGSDHAQLPIVMIESGRAQRAIAVEVAKGPYEATREAIEQAWLQDRIEARLGNGLDPISSGEVELVAIAGMGAQTMWEILTTPHADEVLSAHGGVSLALQPMAQGGLMRYFAVQGHYQVAYDQRVVAHGLRYEVMRLNKRTRGEKEALAPRALELRAAYDRLSPYEKWRFTFGEHGLRDRCPHVLAHMKEEVAALQQIQNRLRTGQTERSKSRIPVIEEELAALMELIGETYEIPRSAFY